MCHGPYLLMQCLPTHPTACAVRDAAYRKANYSGMLRDDILLDSSVSLSVASAHACTLASATAVEVLSHGFRAGFSVHLGIMISGASLRNLARLSLLESPHLQVFYAPTIFGTSAVPLTRSAMLMVGPWLTFEVARDEPANEPCQPRQKS